MKTIQIWLLLLCGLLLAACGSGEGSTAQPPSSPTEGTANSLDTPEATMNFYVASCESGDTVSAKEAVGHNFRFCEFPEDAISSQQSGDFEINGKTARVVWQWTQPEEASEKRLFVLGSGNKGWRIIEENKYEKIWFREETEEIDFEEQEQEDNELPEQIDYVLQEGAEGEKVVREKLTQTWSNGRGTNESEVVSEEIITEAVPRILVRGKKPVTDIETQVTGLVEQYLTNYQNGQYADLTKLAPTAANFDIQSASQIASFEIISVEVRAPNTIRAIKPTSEEHGRGEGARASRKLVLEPFLMEAEVPVFIKYKLFGIEFDFNDKLVLRAAPEDKVWTMPYWGVTEATKVSLESAKEENTITIDGIATFFGTTGNSTLIALTSSDRAQQILVTVEDKNGYAKCIQFPLCSFWFDGAPQGDSLDLVIESGLLGYGSEIHEFNVPLTK